MDSNLEKVVTLVMSSGRTMPAHFTSNGTRTQSFCIDYNNVSADDEYNMASYTWSNKPNIVNEEYSHLILKIGEDIVVAAFILVKGGDKKLIGKLTDTIIERNISLFSNYVQPEFEKEVLREETKEYFRMCLEYGIQVAE